MTEREKMLAGEPYDCADPELMTRWQQAKELTRIYNGHIPVTDSVLQAEILSDLLGSYGDGLMIVPPFQVDYGHNIYLGCDCEINMNCVFLDCNRIVIGDNCGMGPGVQIYTVGHPVNARERLMNASKFWVAVTAPVTIGNNVWIGGGSIILPGVTIGDNVTIGAGSVVTKSIPSDSLAVGNPARVVRKLL